MNLKNVLLSLAALICVVILIAALLFHSTTPPSAPQLSVSATSSNLPTSTPVGKSDIAMAAQAPWNLKGAIIGTLRKIGANNVLTILSMDPASHEQKSLDVVLAKSTQITVDGAPSQISDLKVMMEIVVAPGENDALPHKVDAFSTLPDGQVHTAIGSIDQVGESQIIILAGKKELFQSSLPIVSSTKITVDGQPASVMDLKRRMYAKVDYVGAEARLISAQTVMLDGQPHHVNGTVVSYSPQSIVIHVNGSGGFNVKLVPAKDMEIVDEINPGQAPSVNVGQTVNALYQDGIASNVTVK